MAKNTGKNFENEIRKSLQKADIWWFRIQDTNDVSRFIKQAVAEKQPADFMALYYGSSRSIPSHQIKMARQAQRHGALAFILIRRDEPRNKRVWAITPEQADYLYKKKDGKSVNWKWFHAHAYELKRLKNPVRWEVIPLIEENL